MLFNLTDLIFENRNKLYGAYLLRKNYAYALSIALLCNIPLLIACIAWIKYEQKQTPKKEKEQYIEREIMLQVNEDVEISDISDLPVLAENKEYFPAPKSEELENKKSIDENSNPEIAVKEKIEEKKAKPQEEEEKAKSQEENKQDDSQLKQDTINKQQQGNSEQKPSLVYSPDVWSIYIKQNLRYPPQALRDKKECNVFVAVIINDEGVLELDKERALYGCEEYFNEEVKRLIANAPRFIAPSGADGKPKKRINLKISFKLPQ